MNLEIDQKDEKIKQLEKDLDKSQTDLKEYKERFTLMNTIYP